MLNVKNNNRMLISIAKWYINCRFVASQQSNLCVYIALDSTFTKNNTPSLPLNNAHSGGFFF